MMVNWGWGPKMLLQPVPKSSTRFSYILFRTVDMWVFKFINYSNLLQFVAPVLGATSMVFMVLVPLKGPWIPPAVANPFENLPNPWM